MPGNVDVVDLTLDDSDNDVPIASPLPPALPPPPALNQTTPTRAAARAKALEQLRINLDKARERRLIEGEDARPVEILRPLSTNNTIDDDGEQLWDREEETMMDADDSEYDPTMSSQPMTKGGRRKKATTTNKAKAPKRTREEIQRQAQEKKARKAAEAALKKQQRVYDSDKHVLRYLTVVLNNELLQTQLGGGILNGFLATQSEPEEKRIQYRVGALNLITSQGTGLRGATWIRKVPGTNESTQPPAPHDALQPPMQLHLVDAEEPHLLLCFEAEEFTTSVLRSQFQDVLQTVQAKYPGYRLHLVVHRLDQYLTKRERDDFKNQQQQGRGGSISSSQQQPLAGSIFFNRRTVDDFLHSLTIQAPYISFRDVLSPQECATHVVALTRAIAHRFTNKTDAHKYLSVGGVLNNKKAAAAAQLLANHPIQDVNVRCMMAALSAMPNVGPQIAHAVALRFGSLGALMEWLMENTSGRSIAHKTKEIEELMRPGNGSSSGGGGRRMRVGPKAAQQIVELLLSEDENLLVHNGGD